MTTELDTADIRWRVSNTWDKGNVKWGMLVGYIDSRTAMEALDALDPNWSSKMEPITLAGESGIRCTLIVNGVAREDVGVVSNIDALKGAFSDALKRAAVHFGIGRELYELPKIAVECEVGPTGKVKAPKAYPHYRNGRWEIDRQFGWVKYEREPNEQPDRSGGPAKAASSPSRSDPVQRTPEESTLLDMIRAAAIQHGIGHAGLELISEAVGVPKGAHANAVQLAAILERIETPSSGVPSAAGIGEGDSSDSLPADAAQPDDPPAPAAPTLDDILEATGGELVHPEPGTDEYKALPAADKAKARAWHQEQAKVPA